MCVHVCRNEGQSLMPYSTWEEKLRKRVTQWYKALHDSGDSVDRVRNLPSGSFFGGEKKLCRI